MDLILKRKSRQEDPGFAGSEDFFPIPTRVPPNDEFQAPAQTVEQRRVEAVLGDLAERYSRRNGMSRRQFLKTASGLAAAFLAMNRIYGHYFEVSEAEAADLSPAVERRANLAGQFIFDDQVHYVHDNYKRKGVLQLREYAKSQGWNPELKGEKTNFDKLHFTNFFKEIYLGSDTKVAMLSSAPADHPDDWFLNNAQIAQARDTVNQRLDGRRLLTHAVFTPGQPGWLDQVDTAVSTYKPDAWKAYTVGDPFAASRYPFRLDNEKLVYPAYEKFVKSGIKCICVHKGLLAGDFKKDYPNWNYSMVDDLPKAARDWPELKFIIYHAAFQPGREVPQATLAQFEKSGRIDWVTDLAEIPDKYGLTNIYADIGNTFGITCITHPRLSAGIMGTLIRGLGEDHVLWGTDAVWYGSPQWQIEALRRLEIPEDLRKSFGYAPLGGAKSRTKEKIFALNGAELYKIDINSSQYRKGGTLQELREGFASMKTDFERSGFLREELYSSFA